MVAIGSIRLGGAIFVLCLLAGIRAFSSSSPATRRTNTAAEKVVRQSLSLLKSSKSDDNNLADILSSRLPTSVEDQVRQAADSLRRATQDGRHRHSIRLLLPVIGATDLDDWPGGARQMMEAAYPLVKDIILQQCGAATKFSETLLDASDGVYAIMAQADKAQDDSCTLLLPTADTIPRLQDLSKQVGDKRNLIIVNPQWKRRSDFGGSWSSFFGGGGGKQNAQYVEETFEPTFSLTNLIVEGENIRVLRTYPGPWRVFLRKEDETGQVDWEQVGQKDFVPTKPAGWENLPQNQRDGGLLFSYGLPTYQEIMEMFTSAPNYTPKNPAERAMAAFNFIKDTL